MASAYFDPILGGDGSTVTDDGNPTTGLANGGHRVRFVPALANVVSVANFTNIKAALAKDYAEKINGIVETGTYSAKEWATGVFVPEGSSKEWATVTGTIVGNGEYSAKEYAVGTVVPVGSAKEWATVTGVTIDGVEYSAKEYASGNMVPSGSSKEWAVQTGTIVSGGEYSSKEYAIGNVLPAGSAKKWATALNTPIADNLYSAYEYASGDAVPSGSSRNWANKLVSTVDATDYSAKEHAIGLDTPTGSAKTWAAGNLIIGGLKSSKAYSEDALSYAQTALNAPGTLATSSTSNTINLTGPKTFVIQPNKALIAGQFVIIVYTLDVTQYIIAQITSYNSTTGDLVVSPLQVAGTGTFSSWTIALTAISAGNAVSVGNTDADQTFYPVFTSGTGAQALNIDNVSTPFSYNPNKSLITINQLNSLVSKVQTEFSVPLGTSLNRPTAPDIGSLRFNSDIDSLEVYTSQGWTQVDSGRAKRYFFSQI